MNAGISKFLTKRKVKLTEAPLKQLQYAFCLQCTRLIHGGMDSFGVALFLTTRWLGFMWPTPSETLLNAAGSREPKKKDSSLSSQGITGRVWVKKTLSVLMKWVNPNWAKTSWMVQRCLRDPGSDFWCFKRLTQQHGTLLSKMTQLVFWSNGQVNLKQTFCHHTACSSFPWAETHYQSGVKCSLCQTLLEKGVSIFN